MPTRLDGRIWFMLKFSTIIGSVAKPSRSGRLVGSQFSSVISMQSPALARPTNGSIGTPCFSLPVNGSMSDFLHSMTAVGSCSGPSPLTPGREL